MPVKREIVKEEPEWDECGVSEAEGLYAGHDVKDEIILGPELVQMQDIAFSMPSALTKTEEDLWALELTPKAKTAPTYPGEGFHCNISLQQEFNLRTCFVKLERSPIDYYPCKLCNRSFRYSSQLTRHRRNHQEENIYRSTTCFSQFANKHSLEEHDRVTHEIRRYRRKMYTCDYCKSLFRWKSSLSTHMRLHTGAQLFPCNVCKSQFTGKSSLAIYIPTRMREKLRLCKLKPCRLCLFLSGLYIPLRRSRRARIKK